MSELPKPDHARNMRLVGHSDQGGRPDGVQAGLIYFTDYNPGLFILEYQG